LAFWPALPLFALGAGLNVDSLSPDALCPPLEETRRAVAARLGNVELEGTWRATYVVVHRTRGDFVSLVLLDPQGVMRLERELPVQAGSCSTLSSAIALVLERFFLKPEQPAAQEHDASPPPPPLRQTEPAPEAAPPTQVEPVEPAPSVERDSAPAPATDEPRAFRAGLGLWATTSWLAPTLYLDRVVSGRYRVALSAGFDLSDHEVVQDEGSTAARRAPFALSVQRDFPIASLGTLSAGLDVLGVLEVARTTGLAQSGNGARLVPGLGARLGAWFLPEMSAQPFAALTAAWLLGDAAPAFRVAEQDVLSPPSWVFGVVFGIDTPF
jgi:hypothetical protein